MSDLCKDCDHWGAIGAEEDRYSEDDIAELAPHGISICGRIPHVGATFPHGNAFGAKLQDLEELAGVVDAEAYCATFLCRADFGCILHSAAQAGTAPPVDRDTGTVNRYRFDNMKGEPLTEGTLEYLEYYGKRVKRRIGEGKTDVSREHLAAVDREIEDRRRRADRGNR